MFPHLRPATSADIRFFRRDTSLHSEFRFSNAYLAQENFTLVPLWGAHAVTILVPNGITIEGTNRGHITLVYENGEMPL